MKAGWVVCSRQAFNINIPATVQLKHDLSDEEVHMIEVGILTEILRGEGVLEVVLAKVREAEQPPIYTLDAAGLRRRYPTANGTVGGPLVENLQEVANLGILEQGKVSLREIDCRLPFQFRICILSCHFMSCHVMSCHFAMSYIV